MTLGSTKRFASSITLALFLSLGACSSGGNGTGGHSSTGTSMASSTSTSATGTGGKGGAGGGSMAFTVDDISKKPGGQLEDEPSVAVGTNGVVAAAWNGDAAGKPQIGYAFSSDGGKTWMAPGVASPADAFGYGDPTLATASDGTIYLSFVAFDQSFTMGRLHLAKAAPGATSFEPAIVISDSAQAGPYDKPVIAVTKTGTIVISYTDIALNQIMVARSTDGKNFTRTQSGKSDPAPSLSMPCPSIDGGRMWVVYRGATSVQLRWSDDDGATFPLANALRVSPTTEADVSAEDPVCAGKGNDVWVLYGRSHDTLDPSNFNYKDYALRLAHSSDGGATVASIVEVRDSAAAMFAMEPAIAIEPSGTLDIAYYVGNMAEDPNGSFRLARSTDGGQTFGASTAIASPVVMAQNRNALTWFGDYATIVPSGGRLYAVYGHNVPSPDHISFANLPLQ
jgi:hypothetical protein